MVQADYDTNYTKIRIKIDGVEAWSDDLSNPNRDIVFSVDLTTALTGKSTAKLSIGLYNTSRAMFVTHLDTYISVTSL